RVAWGLQRAGRPAVGGAGLHHPGHSADAPAAPARAAVERGPLASVLYDAPGPRARRRNLLLGVVGTVVLLAAVGFVVYRLAVTGQFDAAQWQWILYKNVQLLLVYG